jgi:hypothetical protein
MIALSTWLGRVFGAKEDAAPMRILQYQIMLGLAEKTIPVKELERPELAVARTDFRKIEAIDKEFIGQVQQEASQRLLAPFLKSKDPWLRAYAAKVLYKIDASAGMEHIRRIVKNKSRDVQLPGVWVLGQLATTAALDLLLPLAWIPFEEVQQAFIRCLV